MPANLQIINACWALNCFLYPHNSGDNLSFMNACKSSDNNFSKILETEGRTLIGQWLCCNVSVDFFFKTGVISADPRSIGQILSSTIQFIRSVKYGNSDEFLRIIIGMWVDALLFLHD